MSYTAFTVSPTYSSELYRSCKDLLITLFQSLETNQVRYCVLNSWEELPDVLYSDLDIAVHPADKRKLVSVLRSLRVKGYAPVQIINYFVGAYCFRFGWIEGSRINSVSLDLMFKHQIGALVKPSAKLLVSSRRRHGIFWVPAPESEFKYLLARRMWKGTAPARQSRRLKLLVEQLGRPTADRLAAELFLGRTNLHFVEACATGSLDSLIAEGKAHARKTSLARNPFSFISNLLLNAARRIRRWLRPTGAFVTVMGPDGAGKSTLIEHLLQALEPFFQGYRVFHWRPMVVFRRKNASDTTRPHSLPQDGRWRSVARLFVHLLDYWFGYLLVIRPLLARTGLVVFDRYFDDIEIDPKRYRYGGPLSLARILRLAIPKPDLVLVLDASEEIILSRKQEIAQKEMQRLRREYSEYQIANSNTRSINAGQSIRKVSDDSARVIFEFLVHRTERRHARWLTPELRIQE